MELNGKQFCDECKKEIIENEDGSYNDCLWLAKDGRQYCDYCYSEVFYPKYYGFTRNAWKQGKAGYVLDKKGNPIKLSDEPEIAENQIWQWWNWQNKYFQQWSKDIENELNKNPKGDK